MADGNAAEIVAGIRNTEEMTVTEDKTAKRAGSGDLEVFSTPDMVALMEKTCLDSVRGALGENSGTVGTLMNIKHVSATPVGMKVRCESVLTEVDRRRLVSRSGRTTRQASSARAYTSASS